MKRSKGTIQVYTGNGKGKTTASLGLAFRALGHGQKVFVIQFMKGSKRYGEIQMAAGLKDFTILQSGRSCFVDRDDPDPRDIRLAEKGLLKAEEVIQSKKYDLIILDEINVAMDFKLIAVKNVLRIIQAKPNAVELVLTGRAAPRRIREVADLVSSIREVKHHYRQGIKARKGVEF
ncbi:MAG: cob(I)yrinic acid a,c-diamide adenosyltransferase [Kiritimatiellae bacterium]|nr:cob(I)yrinic acid a,c-diamide adenosyltransferase [Kiritimatiellia bacterium]